jgi:hypothetical protein
MNDEQGKEFRIQETESRREKQILTVSIPFFHSGFCILAPVFSFFHLGELDSSNIPP